MKTLTITFQRENGSTYDFSSRVDDAVAADPAQLARRITQIEGALHHRQNRRLRHCIVDPATSGVRSESSHTLSLDELGLTEDQKAAVRGAHGEMALRQAVSPGKLTAEELRAATTFKVREPDALDKLEKLGGVPNRDQIAAMGDAERGAELHKMIERIIESMSEEDKDAFLMGEYMDLQLTPEQEQWVKDMNDIMASLPWVSGDGKTSLRFTDAGPYGTTPGDGTEVRPSRNVGQVADLAQGYTDEDEHNDNSGRTYGDVGTVSAAAPEGEAAGDPDTNNDGLVSLDEIDAAGAPMVISEDEALAAIAPIAPERAKAARKKPAKKG